MLVKTYGSAVGGIEAFIITIEVDVAKGNMGYFLVGLADGAVKESRYRIMTALENNSFSLPRKRIVINMAPANIPKIGTAYDLPIALGILAGDGKMSSEKLGDYVIMGEISLDGTLQPIRGVLPIAIEARKQGFKGILLPKVNAEEAAIVNQLEVIPISHLKEAVDFLNDNLEIPPVEKETRDIFFYAQQQFDIDLSDVKGQESVKRPLEICAAGGHNAIMIGPPGSGKTMLAKRIQTILPPMSLHEALETTKIHSVAGLLSDKASLVAHRPYRSPHHTISDAALVGGGSIPQPGEISLAHHGILFLDELPEFKRTVLESLRQPLEEREMVISRSRTSITYPASFILIASMNPCPCGNYNHPDKECVCPAGMVQKYLNKISGPLMDRIDLHIEVTPVPFEALTSISSGEKSEHVRERVIYARERQLHRFKDVKGVFTNAAMPPNMVRKYCNIDRQGEMLLKIAMKKLDLSARAFDRILKVAKTISDLAGKDSILPEHVAEAIQYRSLDRGSWGNTFV